MNGRQDASGARQIGAADARESYGGTASNRHQGAGADACLKPNNDERIANATNDGGEEPLGHSEGLRRAVSRRRFIAGGLGLVGAAAIAARIWYVNANAFDYPERRYGMGDWVDLDGAFVLYARENTKGYSLCVQDAQIMTRREYAERYAMDPASVEPTPYDDVRSVLCVTLAMKNVGNDSGGLAFYDMNLVPEGQIRAMEYAADLWGANNDAIDETMYSFSMLEDSEYTAYVPYVLYGARDQMFSQQVTARRFSFTVSNGPVRNIIDFEVA